MSQHQADASLVVPTALYVLLRIIRDQRATPATTDTDTMASHSETYTQNIASSLRRIASRVMAEIFDEVSCMSEIAVG